METTLLEHSRTHFAQAEGSPFTMDPLNHLLQYDGLTLYGDRITAGKPLPLHEFDEPTKAILCHLQRKVQTPPTPGPPLNHDTLLNGIKKWPECTTTSPSGRHLGIYKSLGKHVVETKKNDIDTEPLTGLNDGRDVLHIIFDLMSLALHHAYPLKRW